MNPDLIFDLLSRMDMTQSYRDSIRDELHLPTEVSVVEVYEGYDNQVMQCVSGNLEYIAVIRTAEGKDFYAGRFVDHTVTSVMNASDFVHRFELYSRVEF